MRKLSFKSFLRGASNDLLRCAILLLCALIVGSSSVWADEVTYTVSSRTAVSSSGAPHGSSATFVNTYNPDNPPASAKYQMTKTNSQTLTLSGYNGSTISNITLSMHSNSQGGSGKLSYSIDGGSTFTYLVGSENSSVQFNNEAWNGAWSQDFVDISKDVNIECGESNLVIKIEATTNSLHCQSYTISYSMPVTGVSLNKASTTIGRGGTETLIATIYPLSATNKNVTWTSNNESVASISSAGVVTGVAAGDATITVTTSDGGYKASCLVTVTEPIAVAGISIDNFGVIVGVGGTESLTTTFTPENATNKNVTWTSNNESVATVSSAGVVTGVAAGNATITVTTSDGGYTASCVVTVASDVASLPFNWEGGTSGELTALSGVEGSSLGDYAAGNAPYRVQMNSTNDYIQLHTDNTPGVVTIGVKMIGGSATSKIKVQESADGSSFTDIEEFTISGAQNDILNFETTQPFATGSRYVKIIKSQHATGGNIGIGPITISKAQTIAGTITDCGWTTFSSRYPLDLLTLTNGVKAYVVSSITDSKAVLTQMTGKIPACTGLMIKGDAGVDFTVDVASVGVSAPETNLLVAVPNGTTVTAADNSSEWNYVFGWTDPAVPGFYLINLTSATLTAGKAFLHTEDALSIAGSGNAPSMIRIVDEESNATNIESIEVSDKAVKFFENGQLLIKRDNVVYDTMGRIIR